MNSTILILSVFSSMLATAKENIKMYYKNADLTKVIEDYSEASGQKFILGPDVRGKITILIQEPISLEEAFNQLSSALAINSYAISKQGDTMVVRSARNVQRDLIEVGTEKPSLKPERLYTWIYDVKNLDADGIKKDLFLISRDGELSVNKSTNQIVFTDWVSNLNRIAELLKGIDKKIDSATAKIIDNRNREKAARQKGQSDKADPKRFRSEN